MYNDDLKPSMYKIYKFGYLNLDKDASSYSISLVRRGFADQLANQVFNAISKCFTILCCYYIVYTVYYITKERYIIYRI